VLLMLDELLAQTDPTKHYWLDFKRHGRLSRAQAEAAAVRLAAIAERAGIARARLWVEGTEPFNLMPFVHAGFRTIFDVHPPADSNPFTPLATQLHKAVFLAGGFTVMGMNYGSQEAPIHGPVARQLLGDIPVFLYHVPTDRALLAELVRILQRALNRSGGSTSARPSASWSSPPAAPSSNRPSSTWRPTRWPRAQRAGSRASCSTTARSRRAS
jgi:hypothetical protein